MSIPVKIGLLLLSLLFTMSQHGSTQTITEIDNRLAAYMDSIGHWGGYYPDDPAISREDSLNKANSDLANYLKNVGSKIPSTMKALFPKAEKERLTIVTSDDHLLQLYSWDSWMGGTMRFYYDMAQYQSSKGLRVQVMNDTLAEADYGCDYTDITTIHTTSNKTIYLVTWYAVASTKDRAEGIDAFIIEDASLKKFNVFHTKTKQLSSICYGYDQFASTDGKRDIPTIHFSKDNKMLYIPVVSGEIVTNKYLVYIFDGNNYVFDKNLH